jgi:mannose-6-phosphate isomerase-like protein (cupin superfamily)
MELTVFCHPMRGKRLPRHLPRLPAELRAISPPMKPSPYLTLLTCAVLGLACSASAADAPKAPPTDVIVFDHTRVDAALQTGVGGGLQTNSLYKVMTSRRVAPGVVEIHTLDTDVFYILDGTATFVTGGTAVDSKQIGPNEFHAKSITGGTEHHLSKGDVIIIPNGTPHQFTEVSNPFLYFVVKATRQ